MAILNAIAGILASSQHPRCPPPSVTMGFARFLITVLPALWSRPPESTHRNVDQCEDTKAQDAPEKQVIVTRTSAGTHIGADASTTDISSANQRRSKMAFKGRHGSSGVAPSKATLSKKERANYHTPQKRSSTKKAAAIGKKTKDGRQPVMKDTGRKDTSKDAGTPLGKPQEHGKGAFTKLWGSLTGRLSWARHGPPSVASDAVSAAAVEGSAKGVITTEEQHSPAGVTVVHQPSSEDDNTSGSVAEEAPERRDSQKADAGHILDKIQWQAAVPEVAQVWNVAYSDKYTAETRFATAKMAGSVKEWDALLHCHHENIVPLLEAMSIPSMMEINATMPGISAGFWMPYAQGGNAASLLANASRHGMLDARSIAGIVRPVAVALAHMHNLNWVHRRVRLEYILFGSEPVMDNGPSAPMVEGSVWLTSFSDACQVKAEEQLAWNGVNERSKDVSALGRVLLTLLFQSPIAEDAGFEEVALKIMNAPRTRPLYKALKRPGFSRQKRLADLARRMMSPVSIRRPAMAEVVEIIDNILDVDIIGV
ncbi:hypothetical protein WJX73_001856 [Symbiochloris irregularis]|uniref:Protein kinase domain-containing protein n=1 Tax=Symbiochloris irregularis TaxID=706552 RepID=A0AAW1PZ47_9CHLO